MRRQILPSLWTVLLALSLAAPAQAEEGWTFSDLNPFAAKPKTSKTQSSRKISEKKSSGWSLNPFAKAPSSAPPIKNTTSRRKSEPSGLTKAWETLTPWDDHPPKKPAPLTTPRSTKSRASSEKGWMESLFGPDEEPRKPRTVIEWLFPEEEPRKPRTVNEWLDQEKPGF